ncbi:unnamed protein product [Camellia sinensis]
MDSKIQAIKCKLNGGNYAYWASVMKNFLLGQKKWVYVSGSAPRPSDPKVEGYLSSCDTWDCDNAQVLTWFHNSVDDRIGMMFSKYSTAKEVWDYLLGVYQQSNFAKRYELETTIQGARQRDQTIQDFYIEMTGLWDQLALMEPPSLKILDAYIEFREQGRLVQFLTALSPQYEAIRGGILHRSPLPSVDAIVRELLSEETRLKTASQTLPPSVFLAPAKPPLLSTPPSHQLQATAKPKRGPLGLDECAFCHQRGHWKKNCPKKGRQPAPSSQTQFRGTTSSTFRPPAAYTASTPAPDPDLASLSAQVAQLQHILSTSQSSPSASALTSLHSGLLGSSSGIPSSVWIFDSGASHHMTPHLSLLQNCIPPPVPITINTANGSGMSVLSVGSVLPSAMSAVTIPSVFYVPQLSVSLLSISQLDASGFDVIFSSSVCCVQDRVSKKQIGTGRRIGDLYVVESLHLPLSTSPAALSSYQLDSQSSQFYLWHSRLGHLSVDRLRSLAQSGLLGKVSPSQIDECRGCKLAKMSALPFNKSTSISVSPFSLVHTDVWGPSPVLTKGGSVYYVSFVDDCTRYTWIYLMTHKSDFYQIYRTFQSMVTTQFGATIKLLRSDLGGEYFKTEFCEYLANLGTIHQTSCTDTPAQNGRAERKHRHLLETARSLLLSASVPAPFWGEAVLTAAFLLNRMPTPLLSGRSPYEALFSQPPNYSLLRVFGSACFVLLPRKDRTKLSARSVLCVFLGYSLTQKGYRCYDPVSRRLYVSRHVAFLERLSYFQLPPLTAPVSKEDLVHIDPFPSEVPSDEYISTVPPELIPSSPSALPLTTSPPSPSPSLSSSPPLLVYSRRKAPPPLAVSTPAADPPASDDSDPAAHRYPPRARHPPKRLGWSNTCFSASYRTFLSAIHSFAEPQSYKEACQDPHWVQAMEDELFALQKTSTWELVPLPVGKNLVGCKWVYKVKTHSDGSLERYKARLVAKGFSQEYGIDYEETFAPVAKMTTVRTLISVAAVRSWPLYQMDVKNAFLNGTLTEEVYMRPPPGLHHSSGQVCRLRRALYGLKQSPRAWYDRFQTAVTELGFHPSASDSALFLRHTSAGFVALLLYVDDMIITGSDSSAISEVKQHLFRTFEMKDLGPLRYFLGIEVASSPKGYFLSQAKYANEVIHRARLTDTKLSDTPIELNVKLNTTDGVPLDDPTLYRELVGCLVYLTVTRPDLTYAVHVISQFVSAPRSTHWAALLRILRYLRSTIFQGLLFSSTSSLDLVAYADADWAGDVNDRKSTSGFCMFLGDSLISWKSKKQHVVARSTAEAEYRAMAHATAEIVWLRQLLSELGVPQSSPTSLYCDNRSAIQIAHNTVFHERTKHIEIDCHFVRQHLQSGFISLPFVSSALQLADFFTKTHTTARFRFFLDKLSVFSAKTP